MARYFVALRELPASPASFAPTVYTNDFEASSAEEARALARADYERSRTEDTGNEMVAALRRRQQPVSALVAVARLSKAR